MRVYSVTLLCIISFSLGAVSADSFRIPGVFGSRRGGVSRNQRTVKFRAAALKLGIGLLGLGGATVYLCCSSLSGTSESQKIESHQGESQSSAVGMLNHTTDYYDGVNIDESSLPKDVGEFKTAIQASLKEWKTLGKKGVWLKQVSLTCPDHLARLRPVQIPKERAELVPVALKLGFELHHAEKSHIMLNTWLPKSKNQLPPNASHQVGVGAFVRNDKDEVLVVREKNGLVDAGENIPDAAAREVKEETGVDAEFVSLLAFRHGHGRLFGKSDLFFIVAMRLKDGADPSHLEAQVSEIEACQWMPREQLMEQNLVNGTPLLREMSRVIEAYVSSSTADGGTANGLENGSPSGVPFVARLLEQPREYGGPSMLYFGKL